jgi:hypothetical protein
LDALGELSYLVERASFTDVVLRIQRDIQMKLVVKLSLGWEADRSRPLHDDPYPRTYYHPGPHHLSGATRRHASARTRDS